MSEDPYEDDYVDVEPFEGDPDFEVPPSKQHLGLEEVQDDEATAEVEGEALGDDLAPPILKGDSDA